MLGLHFTVTGGSGRQDASASLRLGGAAARAGRGAPKPPRAPHAPRPLPLTSQRLPAALGLVVPRRAQIGVVPAAEAVLQVPGALAVPDQHELVGGHGDGRTTLPDCPPA